MRQHPASLPHLGRSHILQTVVLAIISCLAMLNTVPVSSPVLASDLRMSAMRLARRLRQQRADHGLSFGQLSVLASLDRSGAMTAGELAACEQVSPPSMTRTITALLAAGYITRTPVEADRRQVMLDVTTRARSLLHEDRRRRDEWLAERLGELTPEQRAALADAVPVLAALAAR